MDLIKKIKESPSISFSDVLNKVPEHGLIAEFGVYQGNSLKEIAQRFSNRIVYGFDSFEGLSEDWNGHKKGFFQTEPPAELPENITLVTGYFEDTLDGFYHSYFYNTDEKNKTIAFMHIDCDLYSSTKTIFDKSKKYIKPGTIIAFDELIHYGGEEWRKHEYKAFVEFLVETKTDVEILGIYGSHQVGVKII